MAHIVIIDQRMVTNKIAWSVNLTDGPEVKYPSVWAKKDFKNPVKALKYVEELLADNRRGSNDVANLTALETLKKAVEFYSLIIN